MNNSFMYEYDDFNGLDENYQNKLIEKFNKKDFETEGSARDWFEDQLIKYLEIEYNDKNDIIFNNRLYPEKILIKMKKQS